MLYAATDSPKLQYSLLQRRNENKFVLIVKDIYNAIRIDIHAMQVPLRLNVSLIF